MSEVIVIGGGAAGMMAALTASQAGAQVRLIEKNEKLGKKLFITGKGRCNVTNAGDADAFFGNVRTNGKFLYSAFYGYDNRAVAEFLENAGCLLKTERGDRMFPVSDHSSDVIGAFQRELKKMGVDILLNTEVRELVWEDGPEEAEGCFPEDGKEMEKENSRYIVREGETEAKLTETGKAAGCFPKGSKMESRKTEECGNDNKKAEKHLRKAGGKKNARIRGVKLKNGKVLFADSCIVCTGGLSYPSTGSTGDGYRFARETGHSVEECSPCLVPLNIREAWCKELMGLSLKNVSVSLRRGEKELYRGFGEMLFTHFGVSGPLILSASSYCGQGKKSGKARDGAGGETKLYIDLKPALDREQLDRRILRDFEENGKKQFKNALGKLFPAKLIPVMVELSGISQEKTVNEITRQERRNFTDLIKCLPLTVTGLRGYEEAVITKGGVSVKDVNPSTMESKRLRGLYFAGEVLDLDALTGGYNLQIAWSTGHLAGESAAAGM